MGAGHHDGSGRENTVEPNASFHVFHNVNVQSHQWRLVLIVWFKPSVKGAVGDFFEGVLVELDVGLPLGDVIKFASFPLSFDGGFSVHVAFLEEGCDSGAFVGHGIAPLCSS